MNTRDIRVTDVTHRTQTRMMIEPDQRALDILLDRSSIPPLDGAVPEPTDYYSLGAPEYQRRHWTDTATAIFLFLMSAGFVLGLFLLLRAMYRAVYP